MAKTRNRYGSQSGAVSVTYLPSGGATSGSSGGSSSSQPSEASRLSQELSAARSRQALADINDPFIKMVNSLDAQVKFLKSKEAFAKLANDDPKGFLEDAYAKMNELSPSDPQYSLWAEAARRAEEKLEDQQWSNDLKLGLKEYEDFREHLKGKLSSSRPGSADAAELIQALASVGKAIVARDEAKLDQDALVAYTESGNHAAYKRYLESKFLRVKDGGVQSEILKQMGQLDQRTAKDNSIARAQKKSGILTAYLQGGSATDAIAALQELARDNDVSKEEVDALQRSVESVLKREEDKIEDAAKKAKGSGGGSGSGTKAATDAIDAIVHAAQREYEAANSVIQQAVIDKRTPSREEVERLEAAASVLEATYNRAGEAYPNEGDRHKALTAAINVDEVVGATKAAVDAVTLKGADISDAGKQAFGAAITAANMPKDGTAYEAGAALSHSRIISLLAAKGKLYSTGAESARVTELNRVADVERGQITQVAAYKAPRTDEAQSRMDDLYFAYRNHPLIKTALTPKQFETALTAAGSADEFAKKLGFEGNVLVTKKGQFGASDQTQEVFDRGVFNELKNIAEGQGAGDDATFLSASRLWNRLVRTPDVKISQEEAATYLFNDGSDWMIDEDTKAQKKRMILDSNLGLSVDDYLDIAEGRPDPRTKGPAGALMSLNREEDAGLVRPETLTAEGGATLQEFETGTGPVEEPSAQPTINEAAPEETPGDSVITEGDPWEMRDPVEDAFEYLSTPEDFDLQGMTIPLLPEDDSIAPPAVEDSPDFGSWDNPFDDEEDEDDEPDEGTSSIDFGSTSSSAPTPTVNTVADGGAQITEF